MYLCTQIKPVAYHKMVFWWKQNTPRCGGKIVINRLKHKDERGEARTPNQWLKRPNHGVNFDEIFAHMGIPRGK
jgi:hypothetical protein